MTSNKINNQLKTAQNSHKQTENFENSQTSKSENILWAIIRFYLVPLIFLFLFPSIILIMLEQYKKLHYFEYDPKSIIYLLVFFIYAYLSIIITKKQFFGPVNVDGVQPIYAANGFEYWVFSVLGYTFLCCFTNIEDLITESFPSILFTLNVFALLFCCYLYYIGTIKKQSDSYTPVDEPKYSNIFFRYYRGMEFHPKMFQVDVKQFTNCRFSMMAWNLLVINFGMHSVNVNGWNWGIFVNVLLQTLYLGKFFYWETGYFNTLDITLDRGGFYICWGVLVWVPALYTFSTFYMYLYPPKISFEQAMFVLIFALLQLALNYWVDYQKECFIQNKGLVNIWGKPAKFMSTKYKDHQGQDKQGRLLLSGFWGVARHLNYTFELMLAFAWTGVGIDQGVIVTSYAIFLVPLLVHRIYRDEDKCKKKYGEYWDQYCEKVKYRMIPGIY